MKQNPTQLKMAELSLPTQMKPTNEKKIKAGWRHTLYVTPSTEGWHIHTQSINKCTEMINTTFLYFNGRFFFLNIYLLLAELDLSCGVRAPEHVGSVVVARGLSCSVACGILVPRPGIEPTSPALAGGSLTTASPGKSLNTTFLIVVPSEKVGLWGNTFQNDIRERQCSG